MRLFNKLIVVLLLLGLIPVCTIGLIVPREALELIQEGIDALLKRVEGPLSTWQLVLSGLLALIVDAGLIVLLYLQFRPRAQTAIRVSQVASSEAEIVVDALANRLRYYVDLLSDVLEVEPHILVRGDEVQVALDVETATYVDLPVKAEEIGNVARRVVEELGLSLHGAPKLRLRIAPYPGASQTSPEPVKPVRARPAAAWSRPAKVEPAANWPEPEPVETVETDSPESQ